MGKNNSNFSYLSTTGSGVAIGTNISFAGFIRGSDVAGTITLKAGASTLFVNSATGYMTLATPMAIVGPVTMTSSAGDHFVVIYKNN